LERLTLTPIPIAAVTSDNQVAEPQTEGDYPTLIMPPVTVSDNQVAEPSERVIDRAVRLLRENPEFKDKTVRELKTLTGIDPNTWAKAKRRAK
jgi:hypothetical protein